MMKPINFQQLSFPRGLNLDRLIRMMPEEEVRQFISAYARYPRKQRLIVLPSLKCLKKVLCHFYYRKVENGEMAWNKAKQDLEMIFKSAGNVSFKRSRVKKLFDQREREIQNEK